MTPNELGKIAYEKWAKLMHKLLSWEELTANTQQAWTGAATVVSDVVLQQFDDQVKAANEAEREDVKQIDEQHVQIETLRKILKGVGLALEEILNDSLATERSIRAASVRGVIEVIDASLASTSKPG